MKLLFACCVSAATFLVAFAKSAAPVANYPQLLEQFWAAGGYEGNEVVFDRRSEQPMSYALLLHAEALRSRHEAAARPAAKSAAAWLMTHKDADKDGEPGWGLPEAWDAFGDGSINPPNQAYLITTAIVTDALMEACAVPDLLTTTERVEITGTLAQLFVKWTREYVTINEKNGTSFFWYSTNINDAKYAPNVSAYFLGVAMRFLDEHANSLDPSVIREMQNNIDQAATSLVIRVRRQGDALLWDYIVPSDPALLSAPNDLVHQVYILWGLELYRQHKGSVKLPWSPRQAANSLRSFIAEGVKEYPQDAADTPDAGSPARLWGVGAAIAFSSRYGDRVLVDDLITLLNRDYGPLPYRIRPGADSIFYPRHVTHVLWGLAERDFKRR